MRKPGRRASRGALMIVICVLVMAALVRLRVAGVPLERDEGEYAYAGQLILQGIPPYQLAYNMKFPGTYYTYALIMALLGRTPWGIHVGLMLVNAATTLLVFAIGRRLCDNLCAAIAASSFALLSLDLQVMGVFAHVTHFIILSALAGLLVLMRALDSKRPWLLLLGSGTLFGIAVLMKQHAAVFVLMGASLILWRLLHEKSVSLRQTAVRATGRVGVFVLGAALPLLVVCVVFLRQGVLESSWFWTFEYAREYVSEVPASQALGMLRFGLEEVTRTNLVFWLLAGVGLLTLPFGRWSAPVKVTLFALLVASFLATCPGFLFREHYFIVLLPALAQLVGVAFGSLKQLLEGRMAAARAQVVAAATFTSIAAFTVYQQRDYLLSMSGRELSRVRYGSNPFIESVEIARYIRDHTDEADRIAVLGSEPEIYFYAQRRSATGTSTRIRSWSRKGSPRACRTR